MTDTSPPPFVFYPGTAPLLVSMPHAGTYVPPALAARFTDEARQVPDTDWHMERLYAFAKDMGASILVATHSRYVVDTFDDTPIYAAGDVPDEAEIAARRDAIWAPYHTQLRAELDRIRAQHGVAVLWDAHSIRSVLPRFFEGKLPDLNLGTANGESCDPALAQELLQIAEAAPGYTAVLNGRFKGGHITRHYGQPGQGVHAVQLEMTQCSYMQECLPFDYLPERAVQVQPHLQRMLAAALDFARASRI